MVSRWKPVLLVFLILSTAGFAYESRYDSIGPEALINNLRLYRKYFDCIVNNGRCTPDARFIKGIVGDALPTLCEKCNDKQRYFADTIVKFMIEFKPDDYKQLEEKFDPEGRYRKNLEKRKV